MKSALLTDIQSYTLVNTTSDVTNMFEAGAAGEFDNNLTLSKGDNVSDEDGAENTTTLVIMLTCLSMVFIISLSVNLTILMAFYRKQSLRTIGNSFTINLLVINVVSSLVFLPLVSMDLVMSPVSLAGQCLLSDAVSHLIASLSMLSTLLIAVDQYLAILHALRYHHHMTRLRSSLSLGIVWVLSSVITFTALCIHHRDIAILGSSCEQADSSPLPLHPGILPFLFSCANTAISFLVPTLLIIIIYSRIYLEAHNSSERSRKCSLKPSDFMNNTDAKVPLQRTTDGSTQRTRRSSNILNILKFSSLPPARMRSSSTTSCVDKQDSRCKRKTSLPANSLSFKENLGNIRHRISNAGQFIHREEGKTAKVYIISIAAVIICWYPLAISRTVKLFLTSPLPCLASFITHFLALSYAVVSPFIFAYRNKKVKREVVNMLNIKIKEDIVLTVSILSVPSMYEGQSVKDSTRKRKEATRFLLDFSGDPLIKENMQKTISFVETIEDYTEPETSKKSKTEIPNQFLSVSFSTDTSARSSFSSASTTFTRLSSQDEKQ